MKNHHPHAPRKRKLLFLLPKSVACLRPEAIEYHCVGSRRAPDLRLSLLTITLSSILSRQGRGTLKFMSESPKGHFGPTNYRWLVFCFSGGLRTADGGQLAVDGGWFFALAADYGRWSTDGLLLSLRRTTDGGRRTFLFHAPSLQR